MNLLQMHVGMKFSFWLPIGRHLALGGHQSSLHSEQ